MRRYYLRARDVASRIVAGEAVLIKAPENRLFVLNAAASRIWVDADGSRTGAELAGGIEVQHVEPFLGEMVSKGLMECRASAAVEPQVFPQRVERPEAEPEAPAIRATETIEVLAGTCDSDHTGGPNCRLTGFCLNPST